MATVMDYMGKYEICLYHAKLGLRNSVDLNGWEDSETAWFLNMIGIAYFNKGE